MKPVMQTQFLGQVGPGAGNCHAACVASILELPLEQVPNFLEIVDEDERYQQEQEWLASIGFYYVCTTTQEMTDKFLGWHVAIGPNARNGTMHSCVYYGLDLRHDPNPAGGGLREVEYRWFLIATRMSFPRRGKR